MTKKEKLNAILTILTEGNADTELIDYCENEIALLDKKAIRAKEAAAKKRAEGDAFMEVVADYLTPSLQTLAAITTALAAANEEDITTHKVSYRLSQLVKAGRAEKGEITVDKRKMTGYRLAEIED